MRTDGKLCLSEKERDKIRKYHKEGNTSKENELDDNLEGDADAQQTASVEME